MRFWELALKHCSLSVPGCEGRLNKGFICLGISIQEVICKCLCIYCIHIFHAVMTRNYYTQPWLKHCLVRYISCKWLLGCLCSLHIGGFVEYRLDLSCDAAHSKVCLTCFLKESFWFKHTYVINLILHILKFELLWWLSKLLRANVSRIVQDVFCYPWMCLWQKRRCSL